MHILAHQGVTVSHKVCSISTVSIKGSKKLSTVSSLEDASSFILGRLGPDSSEV